MSHTFHFQVTQTVAVEVAHVEGKFATRDEIAEVLGDALNDAAEQVADAANEAALDGLGPDGSSVYEVETSTVDGTDAFEVFRP
jgi:hypothetical protein